MTVGTIHIISQQGHHVRSFMVDRANGFQDIFLPDKGARMKIRHDGDFQSIHSLWQSYHRHILSDDLKPTGRDVSGTSTDGQATI